MSASELNPATCAAFLVATFTLAGFCQTAWLAAPVSRRFAVPLDGGHTLFGRRLFGANKTVRGFVMIVPATSASFALLAALLNASPAGLAGLWSLSVGAYAWLGLWAGLGFMAGELPNSFVKRQLGVPPGAAARGRLAQPLFFLVDRLDSIVGTMLALGLLVPVSWRLWVYVALIGPVVHWLFSVALFHVGVKARAA
jgi:CDP-2,3-bis-(O-geranylgeranyl)-sn-glycerol synthase